MSAPQPPDRPMLPRPFGEQPVTSAFGGDSFAGPQPAEHTAPFRQPNPFPSPVRQPDGRPDPAPPGYQQYGSTSSPVGVRTNGFAVTSMVLGIVGIPLFCLFGIPSILAVIFGAVSLRQFKADANAYTGRGMAVAGLVLGLVGIALLAAVLVGGNFHYSSD